MTPVGLLELVLALMAAALVLSLIAGRLALPPAAALVLGGMALALTPGVPGLDLDPDLIMVLFLPPLLLSSAFFTVWRDFRADIRPIMLLAVGAVAFTTFGVGVVTHWVAPSLPWAACFALGAIVSPPDAVAAKAVLQRLNLPRRLLTVLEGESLVNDASGLVLYRFAVAAALTGRFDPGEAALSFVWLAVGGVVMGLVTGALAVLALQHIRDTRLAIVTSFLTAYASYIGAERLQASGVLAVVACGLFVGWRQHVVLGALARTEAKAVWNVVVFVLEALVFVLIGLSLNSVLGRMGGEAAALSAGLPMALAVTGAVLVSRLLWVFPAVYLPRLVLPGLRARDPNPPLSVPLVIGWAGMRGVVSLAAALALPVAFPGRDLMLFATFVVIVVTVLLQGTTLGPLIRALRPALSARPAPQGMSEAAARAQVATASLDALERRVAPDDGRLIHPRLVDEYRGRVRATTRLRDEGEAVDEERRRHFEAALDAVSQGRTELIRLHRGGQVHDSVLHNIETELDLEELRLLRYAGIDANSVGHGS